jgi:hypothetical protein
MQVATDICKPDDMDEKIELEVCLEGSYIHECMSQPILEDMPVYPGEPYFTIRKERLMFFYSF